MPIWFSSTTRWSWLIRREPDVGQVLDRIVLSLDSLLVNQPFGPDLSLHRTDRQDLEADGVVAQHVIPDRGIVEEQAVIQCGAR